MDAFFEGVVRWYLQIHFSVCLILRFSGKNACHRRRTSRTRTAPLLGCTRRHPPLLHLGIETNRFWHSQGRRTNFLSQKHRGDRASSSANHTLVATEPQVLRQDEGDSGALTDEECVRKRVLAKPLTFAPMSIGRTNTDTGSPTCTPLLVHPATETESEGPVT